jgi:hypothetical protein
MPEILATQELDLGRLRLEVSQDKKYERPYFNEKAGYDVTCLSFYLLGKCK